MPVVPNPVLVAGAASRTSALRLAAAREIVAVETALARAGRTLLDHLADGFVAGEHYPSGEVWDPVTHAQYFYHAHPEGGRAVGEHGHFHTFMGEGGMPPGVAPLVLPEMALAPSGRRCDPGTHRSRRDRGVFSHLIGISVDDRGRPISLFTTNRWVTGETWYRAADVLRMLPRFEFAGDGPSALVDRWLAAVLALLRERIAALIGERDERIMAWRRGRSRHEHVFDDRRLELVSTRRVDYRAELAAALAQSDGAAGREGQRP